MWVQYLVLFMFFVCRAGMGRQQNGSRWWWCQQPLAPGGGGNGGGGEPDDGVAISAE